MSAADPGEAVPKRSLLPYTSYPHILDLILHFSEYATLLVFRRTSSSLKAAVARELCYGPLVVDVDEPKDWEDGDGVVVFRTRRGVLPFLREEDWAWALSRADAVEVDGWCLGPPRLDGHRGPRPPARNPAVNHRCDCASCRSDGSDDDDDFIPTSRPDDLKGSDAAHPTSSSTPTPTGSMTNQNVPEEPCVDLAAIKRALSHIRREVPLTVLHSWDRPLPTFIPPVDALTLRLDNMCDCAWEGRPDPAPPTGALHSATKLTILVSPLELEVLDEDVDTRICQVAWGAVLPSVRHLTLSVISVLESNNTFCALAEGPGKMSGGRTLSNGLPERHPDFEVDFRVRYANESDMTEERIEAHASYIGVPREKFTFTLDPHAGDLASLPPLKCGLLKS